MKNIFDKINQLDGVIGKIAFKKGSICVAENSLNLHLIADFYVSDKLISQIEKTVLGLLPNTFARVNCKVEKVMTDFTLVLKRTDEFLFDFHKAIHGFFDFKKSEFNKKGYNASLKLFVDSTCYDYVKEKQILQKNITLKNTLKR